MTPPAPSHSSLKKKVATVLTCVAALAGVAVLGVVAISAASANPTAAFGAYDGATTPPTALNSALGGHVTYAMDFQDGTSWSSLTGSSWPYSQWKGKGYSMIWGMPMLPNTYSPSTSLSNTSGSCYGLTQEAAGAFNSDWTKIAQAMVANGFGTSIVRPGWEFNGNWFPWAAGGCASAYVGAYQQIVTSMRAVSGANFAFEWNPTLGDQGVGNLSNFYPGNAYVNYIGSDVYDTATGRYPGAQAEFTTIETEPYGLNWLSSFAAQEGKQIVLPEWGLGWGTCNAGQPITASNGGQTCGGDNPTFINDMSSWIKANNVFEVNFWNYNSSSVSGCPSRCTPIGPGDDDTNTIAAGNINSFNALVADFGSGSGSGSPTTSTTSIATTTTTFPLTTTTTTTTRPPPTTTTTTTTGAPSGVNVSRVSPGSGSTAGGTTVTITGSGFSGATAVDFGSTPATIGSVSATSITATAPASPGGSVNVTVTASLGRSPVTSVDQFTYIYPKPSVTSMTPSAGVPGTVVTISGSGFTGATGVSFGSAPASFTVNSNNSITATAPSGSPTSAVDVTIAGPGGASNVVAADRFSYGPVVSAVSPLSGSHLGGTTITIKGAGFTGASAVSFGGVPVTSAITVNATGTQVTVSAPAHAAGTVDVTVTVGSSTTTTSSSDQFTYF
jgi:IPT/TIG domain/Glycosyl hydrolase family 26